jgi:hypothetical protein
MTREEARRIALALPEAIEQDHHGRPSFRVAGKIFATLWSQTELNVMLGEEEVIATVEREPTVCSSVRWGKRLTAVRINLRAASDDLVEDLLAEAWASKAPSRLTG